MRKVLAVLFAVLAFNLVFFPFQKQFFGFLLIPHIGTIGFASLIVAFHVFQYVAFYDSNDQKKKKNVLLLSAASVVLTIMSVFRTSSVDIFLFNFLSLIASLLSLYVFTLPFGETIDSIFEIVISPIALFFEGIAGFFRGLKYFRIPKVSIFRHVNTSILYVLAGFLVGLPIVFLITALLSSADPVFSKFVTNLFSFKDFPWWFFRGSISRSILSGVFACFAIAIAYMRIKKPSNNPLNKLDHNESARKTSLMAISIVAMVSLVLGAFLVVGYPYLFASVPETELSKFGVNTLSEYVTKGFSELIIVSTIVYISSALAVVIYKLGGRGSEVLKWFNLFLLSETVVFILSIFRRVSIYQETHGLTRVRIYGSVFLTALIALTVFLMFRHSRKVMKWFWYELAVFMFAGVIIFFAKPDYLIANKYKPTVNGEIDYVHIVRLSPEAVDGWIEAYKDAKSHVDNFESISNNPLIDVAIDERRAYYTFLTLNILRQKNKELTLKYGSAQEIFDARATYGPAKPSPDFKKLNIAEKAAYQKLKENIDVKELIEYEEKAYKLVYNYRGKALPQQNQYNMIRKYDRSLESPLLEEVRVVR